MHTLAPGLAVRIPGHVVHRAFATETVILDLETGKYHGVNVTGGRMLEAIERHGLSEDAVAILAEEFRISSDELREDLREFAARLLELGLLERVPEK